MSETDLVILLKDEGIEAWNAMWKERNENDEFPDLSNANLRRMNLAGVNFLRASLRNADLREADLRNAYLQHAELDDADLRGANFITANLTSAALRRAKLDGTTKFHESILDHVDFCAASLNAVRVPCEGDT